MPHLVKPLPDDPTQPISITRCFHLIESAHDYLVTHAATALEQIEVGQSHPYWGSQLKRVRVALPSEDRPALIDPAIQDHSLTEIYNQCATMERLLDALKWANAHLRGYQVIRCHPTTSSVKQDESAIPDNDLVLINTGGELARFEVSDVASEQDGNHKEDKDLMSLDVLGARSGPDKYVIDAWPAGRLFMVVSSEFAVRLRKKCNGWPAKNPHYHYLEVKPDGGTRIFEVLSQRT